MTQKKKSFSLVPVLSVLLAATCLVAYKMPEITYNYAKSFYDKGDYANAVKQLEFASRFNADNLDLYYLYAKSLDALPMSYEVQQKLFNLARVSKSGAAASIANDKINQYKYFILKNTGANYVTRTPYGDKVLRWDPKKFPIKVYIEPNSTVPSYYHPNVEQAFKNWIEATGSYINFEFVDNETGADIVYKFIDKDNSACAQNPTEDCKFVLAYATPTVSGNKLKKFDIVFSKKDIMGNDFPESDILIASMHEIGHALGILGHSFNEDNLMYPSNIEQNPLYSKYRARGITMQDVNTVRLLYAMLPDISNGEFSEEEKQKLVYPPVILGDKTEINNEKIAQAKQYIEEAPTIPNGYVDLANAYYELKNYQEAINNLYTAYQLATSEAERYPLLYNIAVTYFESRDYNNALQYAEMAANISGNNMEINSLIGYLKYKLGNKEFAVTELKSLIAQAPSEITPSYYLVRALVEDKRLDEAKAIFNTIKTNNPDAASDPRFTQFGALR